MHVGAEATYLRETTGLVLWGGRFGSDNAGSAQVLVGAEATDLRETTGLAL
jgi:hypothetical protein